MKYKQFVTVILIVVFAGFAVVQVSAFSIKEILGLGDDEEQVAANEKAARTQAPNNQSAESTDGNWGKLTGSLAGVNVNFANVQQIFANLNGDQRTALLADREAFQNFINQETDNSSLLTAAINNAVDQDANTVFLMQRGAQSILRESYLGRLINSKLPADFPTDEQVKEYYEKNRSQFVLGERVHVWQVFLSTEDADKTAQEKIQKQAETIAGQLASGELDFNHAVKKYSEHEQSKANGGYMGLIKVAELKSELRDSILDLSEGKISKPTKSDTGIHIFKRGVRLEEQNISFDQVDIQIRQLLIQQARAQLRKAVFDQARQTYPQGVEEATVEEWRLRLRGNRQSAKTGAR